MPHQLHPLLLASCLALLPLAFLRGATADEGPVAPVAPKDPPTEADSRVAQLEKEIARLYRAGKYKDALAVAEQCLALREAEQGPAHPDTARALKAVGNIQVFLGTYAAAQTAFERAIGILERAGPDYQGELADGLNSLGWVLGERGALTASRSTLERALETGVRALGSMHRDVGVSHSQLGGTLLDLGEFALAREHYLKSLTIGEATHGPESIEVAPLLNNLAVVSEEEGNYPDAVRQLERALAIWERLLEPTHPEIAAGLANLGFVLAQQGHYARARELLERALAIREAALGTEHDRVADVLSTLAGIHGSLGQHAEALALHRRSAVILEKVLGPAHPQLARSLNSIGLELRRMGDREGARAHYERALKIHEAASGTSPGDSVATCLNNLSALLRFERRMAEAKPLQERALAIQLKRLGELHPRTLTSRCNLGQIHLYLGDLPAAREELRKALAGREELLGPGHESVATVLVPLAEVSRRLGEAQEARALHARVLDVTEAHVRGNMAGLVASQRRALLRGVRYRLDGWLRQSPGLGSSGYDEVLRFRGLVARVEAAERWLIRHAAADDAGAISQLAAANRRISALASSVPSPRAAEARAAWKAKYAKALAEREALTARLESRLAGTGEGRGRLDLGKAAIQAALPPQTTLVEFLRVGRTYVAWVLEGAGEPLRVELGSSEDVESACADFLLAVTRGDDAAATGARLRGLVWAPLEAHLRPGVRQVIVCPDAALAAIPFGALPGRTPGRWLLDEVALTHVLHAQDLVPAPGATSPGAGALLVGAIDYETAADPVARTKQVVSSTERPPLDRAPQGPRFLALAETEAEVTGLQAKLGAGAELLRGAAASEGRVRVAARGKRYLHIATHGFAREDLLHGLYGDRSDDAWTSAAEETQLQSGHDPMLLCGLAMAGANPRDGGDGEDGILTALEASYLSLDGVDLVALSACETARGTAESGEGVLGLVSAFQMAGARSVLASLWKVDDEATRLLMEGFYERLLRAQRPLSPADALREASLALRERTDADGRRRFGAPRYWAAFLAYQR